ncbi:MAG: hypothetical protein LUE17_00860, partial [Planctomycetaceae bacterium]|nr:hypothetical protein [Planctomycetaceae bacterium]
MGDFVLNLAATAFGGVCFGARLFDLLGHAAGAFRFFFKLARAFCRLGLEAAAFRFFGIATDPLGGLGLDARLFGFLLTASAFRLLDNAPFSLGLTRKDDRFFFATATLGLLCFTALTLGSFRFKTGFFRCLGFRAATLGLLCFTALTLGSFR